MTTDFGTDINTPGLMDLDPHFNVVSGTEAFGQALGRRLVTASGSLDDDPAYGYDVRAHLNEHSPNTTAIEAAVKAQLELDERVERARCVVTFSPDSSSLLIVADVDTAAGPFRLTLDVSAVTVAVLLEAV